jgi:hypothetical protein
MSKNLVLLLILTTAVVFGYIIYDMMSKSTEGSLPSEVAVRVPGNTTTEVAIPTNTYVGQLFSFEYPAKFTLEENQDDADIVLFPPPGDGLPIKFYTTNTPEDSFETYVAILESEMEAQAATIPNFSELGLSYSFDSKIFNGVPVLIHERNFEGVLGMVQEAHIWLDNGQVTIVYTEASAEFLGIISSISQP